MEKLATWIRDELRDFGSRRYLSSYESSRREALVFALRYAADENEMLQEVLMEYDDENVS